MAFLHVANGPNGVVVVGAAVGAAVGGVAEGVVGRVVGAIVGAFVVAVVVRCVGATVVVAIGSPEPHLHKTLG